QVPAENRLSCGLSMSSRDVSDRVIFEHGTLCERAPGLGCDSVLLVPGAQLALLHIRMELDLVDRRTHLGLSFESPEIVDPEVRNADRPRPSLVVNALEGAPCLDEAVLRRNRPMDEVEVDVLHAESPETLVEGLESRVEALV